MLASAPSSPRALEGAFDRGPDQEDPDQAERDHPGEMADHADHGDPVRVAGPISLGLVLLEELP